MSEDINYGAPDEACSGESEYQDIHYANLRRRKGRLKLEDRSQESRFAKTSMIDSCIMRMKCRR